MQPNAINHTNRFRLGSAITNITSAGEALALKREKPEVYHLPKQPVLHWFWLELHQSPP